jgi:hypothetical protein
VLAVAAGGHWPGIADELIERSLAEDNDERDAGLRTLPVGMVLMADLHAVWPNPEPIDGSVIPTRELVAKLIAHNPEYWGPGSSYGKALTDTRLGRMVAQASKITSQRPGGRGPRGYLRTQFDPVWHRLGIGRIQPGALGEPGEPGERSRVNRDNHVHRVERDTPDEPGVPVGLQEVPAELLYVDPSDSPSLCPDCERAPARNDTGRCDFCTAKARKQDAAVEFGALNPRTENYT